MPPGLQMLPAEMALRPGWRRSCPRGRRLPPGRARSSALAQGDTLRLEAGLVQRSLKGERYTMYAFNGQYPGPLIEAVRGVGGHRRSSPTGCRIRRPCTGTGSGWITAATECPTSPSRLSLPAGEFTYRLRFPDAGIYWYHPHVREDIQQELGLYGNLLVRSDAGEEYGPANREAVLMLDDILHRRRWAGAAGQGVAHPRADGPLRRDVSGERRAGLPAGRRARRGGPLLPDQRREHPDVQPLLPRRADEGRGLGCRAVRAGGVGARAWCIAPAERYVVHVRFDRPGTVALVNRVRGLDHLYGKFFPEVDTLGTVRSRAGPGRARPWERFAALRHDTAAAAEMERFRRAAAGAPEKALVLTLETRGLPPVTQRLMQLDSIYFAPMEWSGTMPMMNWASTGRQVRWIVRDPATGRENMDVDWRFRARQAGEDPPGESAAELPRDAAPDPPPRPAVPGAVGERRAATRTWSGRTPCCCRRAPRWIFCSTRPIPAGGCCTATSPSTSRRA